LNREAAKGAKELEEGRDYLMLFTRGSYFGKDHGQRLANLGALRGFAVKKVEPRSRKGRKKNSKAGTTYYWLPAPAAATT
jgi:hypothetical protein